MIRNDNRAVTAPLEYVYTFTVATILITGLVTAATNTAGDQRSRTVEAQMEVVSNQVAGSLEKMDRIAMRHEPDGSVDVLNVEQDFPDELLGSDYFVTVESGSTVDVTVSSSLSENTVTTTVTLEATEIDNEQEFDGGDIRVKYESDDLVVYDV